MPQQKVVTVCFYAVNLIPNKDEITPLVEHPALDSYFSEGYCVVNVSTSLLMDGVLCAVFTLEKSA